MNAADRAAVRQFNQSFGDIEWIGDRTAIFFELCPLLIEGEYAESRHLMDYTLDTDDTYRRVNGRQKPIATPTRFLARMDLFDQHYA